MGMFLRFSCRFLNLFRPQENLWEIVLEELSAGVSSAKDRKGMDGAAVTVDFRPMHRTTEMAGMCSCGEYLDHDKFGKNFTGESKERFNNTRTTR